MVISTAVIDVIGIIASIFTSIGVIVAIIVASSNNKKDTKTEVATNTENETHIKVDLEYMKRGIDDIKEIQREIRSEVTTLNTKIIRVEESVKSAHKRIDSLENAQKG